MCNDLERVSRLFLSFGRNSALLRLDLAFQWLTLELVLPAGPTANTISLRAGSIGHGCFVER